MTELVLALLIGASLGLFVWSLRLELAARFKADVAWVEHWRWRFSPDPIDARPLVAGFYAGAIGLFLLLALLLNPLLALILWGGLVMIPRMMIHSNWNKRRAKLDDQLPIAVLGLSSSVASGMTLVQAMERLAAEGDEPIRTEFQLMANYWRMGADFSTTLEEAKRRLDLPDFSLFSSALLINQRMGGNVVITLDRLAHSLDAVARMRRDVFVATSEGRMNAKVLAASPIAFILFGLVIDPEAVGWLFTKTGGHVILAVAGALDGAGFLWAWKIVKSDV